ncbi:MAG: hypothetical protein ACREVX_09960 [Clostridium sp.]|uniref:hypothetical protein n=1 Tax=Clostridium sp. TaxID=1506 RepID=UPI003D6D2C16
MNVIGLSYNVEKDNNGQYFLEFYYNQKLIATNSGGELSIEIENEDRSYHETILGWKADDCKEGDGWVKLTGNYYCKILTTNITVEVKYSIVNKEVLKKEISLFQSNIPMLFYSVKNTLTPVANGQQYWSFDKFNHEGGIVHGTYPAAGFISKDNIAVGLLTDAGHRNLWTRNTRRRPNFNKKGFTAIQKICDARLLTIEHGSVNLQFGNLSDYSQGDKKVMLCLPEMQWIPMEGSTLEIEKEEFEIKGEKSCGCYLPYILEDGYYEVSFEYKASAPLHLKVLKDNPKGEIQAFHYQDDLPCNSDSWLAFEDTFFISDTENLPSLLQLWQSSDSGASTLRIRSLKVTRHIGKEIPYHKLKIGCTESKTIFIFAKPASSIRELRLASQICLSDGLEFLGSDVEKILFADMQMLTWITSNVDFTPLNVPSINYAPDMYNRDSFWSICGIDDEFLSKKIFDRWGKTQIASGGIGTIVTPCTGSIEVKGNEATCEWLWWALINKNKYGITPPWEKIKSAFSFCWNEFDPEKSGICQAHFVMGQYDVSTYPGDKKTSALSVNQGVWAITLQVARDLGLDVNQEWIDKAIDEYRAFYDSSLGYMINDKCFPYAISVGDLMPEFVSLWLWNKPMLNSEVVLNTLDRIPVIGDCAAFIGHEGNKFFSKENKPCDLEFFWQDGIYYNGGSWMREEIMAYVCGMKHGWKPAKQRIEKRLLAEINLNDDEPFSHEFLPLDLSQKNCWWPSTRVFCWNVFSLTALKVAGLRK